MGVQVSIEGFENNLKNNKQEVGHLFGTLEYFILKQYSDIYHVCFM